MKFAIAFCSFVFAVCAWSDEQAPITISGKGSRGIEVRDSSGKVTEVVNPKDLRLNQIPADAVAREAAYRAKVQAQAEELAARRAEDAAAAEAAAKEAAELKAKQEAEALAAAVQAQKEHEEHYPRKVRRTTVRGTRYLENPPPPREPAPTGEVLSMSGKKKPAAESNESPAPAKDKDSSAETAPAPANP